MADFKLSEYQEKIQDFFLNHPHDNMLVNALAGSGKTTTVKLLLDDVNVTSVYLAFNASVAEEFKVKITNPKVKVYTLHSLAYSIMLANLPENQGGFGKGKVEKVSIDNLKIYKIVENYVNNYEKGMDFFELFFWKENFVALYNLIRTTLTDYTNIVSLKRLIKTHGLFIDYEHGYNIPNDSVLLKVIDYIAKEDLKQFEQYKVIDFGAMPYITYLKLKNKEWKVPYYHLYYNIGVDEAQDVSVLLQKFLPFIKRKGGRFIFIGDHHQCQPAGTKVSLIDGQEKNIEDLVYGDRIVEYSTERGDFRVDGERFGTGNSGLREDGSFRPARNNQANELKGVSSKGNTDICYEVIDKQRFYVDHLITIETANQKKSSYTTNHNCFVKFNREATQEATCLYLMERRDGTFRIGIVKMYASTKVLGIKTRARSEGFDRCWILNIYDNREDAWVAEQTYSLKYQIPQIIFQTEKINYTEEDIKKIYMGAGENLRAHAIALLEEFGRDINYPLWTVDNLKNHTARDHCFITQACNIIPKYMDALSYEDAKTNLQPRKGEKWGKYRPIYTNITNLKHSYGHFVVYGITTSVYHSYVADGLVTHNSIYGFAGADSNSFMHIKENFAPIETFDLPICYRCPTSHLTNVNRTFGIPILPRPDAPKGEIIRINKEDICRFAKGGDKIVSRYNRWLAPVILDLATHGIPVCIPDKELVENLKKVVTKRAKKCPSTRALREWFDKDIRKYQERVSKIVNSKVLNEEHKENLSLKEQVETVADSNSKIDNINFVLEILKYYQNRSGNTSTLEFQKYLDKLLNTSPSSDCVTLSSVHKAKGLEADNVFVLNEGKVCFDPRNSPELQQQEKNLSYISLTRAKNKMYLVKEPSVQNTKRG